MDNVFLSLAGNHPLMENGRFPVMVQNPHFASWTQLSAQTAGNAAAAAAAAAAAVQPGTGAPFQFPNANSFQHLQSPDSSTATSRSVNLDNSASVSGTSNNFSLGLQSTTPLTLQHSIPSQTHAQSQQHQQLHQHQIQLQQQQQHQHQLQLQQQIQLQQQQFRQQQLQQHSLQQQARLSNPSQQQQQQLHQHLQRQPVVPQSQQMNPISGVSLQTTSTNTSQSVPTILDTTGFGMQSSPTLQTTPAVHNQLSPRTSILNITNFPSFTTVTTSVKQKRKSKTTSKKPQTEVISSSTVLSTSIPTCDVVGTLCPTSAVSSFNMIPMNGSLSSISSTGQTNSIPSNAITSSSETCVSPLPTVLSPLPTLPEEILLKIDPSLGDPPPPPHADITITKPYQCDICFKRYSGMKSLKNHKLTHSDIRPHKCSICGKAFLRADKMRLHEISHLNVKPFECTTCKQRFTRSDKLKIHHRTHTGVRPYACTFCPKRFTRSDKLKIHERIHTKVKPYECSHCGKCFARSDKRRLHEKTHMYGPKPRATGGKKSKTTSTASAAAAAAAAVVAAASAASFLSVNSIGKTLGLPLTVANPSISVNNSSCSVFDFSSITNVCTTSQSNVCFSSYHNVSSAPSNMNEKTSDAQQIPSSLSTISFPLPTCQQLHLPSQHHSTLASLAGIAQYHPALFSAHPRQFSHTATAANPVSFYPTSQTTSMGFTTANSGSYPHAQVMPFLVNSNNTGASSSISFLGSNAVSDSGNNNCSVANTSGAYQSSSQKMGADVTSFPVSTSGLTQRAGISPISDPVSVNPTSTTVANTNIAAVMAAAALGRQFHQTQQQYPQIVAYSASQQIPNVSAFIHQQQRQQLQENQQSQETGQQQSQQQAHFVHHQTQSKQIQSQQHPPQQTQQQQPRSQFQFYQPQFAHQFQHSSGQLQQDHQHQMLQHQQQVIQLHQQLQQQQQQTQQQTQTHQQQQQLMQQHSAMLQQQGLISPAHSGTSVAAFSLFPQAAAQFIPGVVPAQYAAAAAAAAAHSTHQQYMQAQQQQYLAAAAAAAAVVSSSSSSSAPVHSLTLTTSHQLNNTTTITPTTSSIVA